MGGLDLPVDGFGQAPVAGGVGMDSVALVVAVAEQVADDLRIVREGEALGELAVEFRRLEDKAEFRDADQDDVGAARPAALDHGGEVGGGPLAVEALQEVVAAVTEDHQLRAVLREQVRQALQPGGGDFAGDAGIDHRALEQPGQNVRVGLPRRGTVAMGEAVTEGQDHGAFGQGPDGRRLVAGTDGEEQQESEKAS